MRGWARGQAGAPGLACCCKCRGCDGFKHGCGCLYLSNTAPVRVGGGQQRKQGDRLEQRWAGDSGGRRSATNEGRVWPAPRCPWGRVAGKSVGGSGVGGIVQ